ncbi:MULTISPECIES: maltose alpha-D-glucosyltransferase [unclassified Acidiphilium]|uniref:maltose alpha-D-glucosyltransferase n=1 Tax=unclassified Acidiphilium TaxID=2617493 RepID=UPI000BCD0F6D|nr:MULTISPECIES: maltose alpha-D-glucosyltransferase [unclassified Acidiphilium]OYV55845.1 MAG: maltose alpha-D-glucosyltransferase [Acidiphilium sp. 20-67-58]HQT60346.1 maltose alpha-D-glucosyltransferase [Acidiphilium sp.]
MTRHSETLFRPDAQASDPQWFKDAIIYQVHVKSFFDRNGDGVGDFAGLMEKLDYIVDLGVTAIWLLPFYPSPRRDDGYDVSGYRAVHPEYGTLGDVRRFIDAAHRRGLRVITELVINHTSDQHPWFQRARLAKPGSSARDYYVWSDNDQKYAGTRVIFVDLEKSNWTWDATAGAYYWHRFYSHQPDLNFDNPRVFQEVLGIMRFWVDLGVDGFRLDAVGYLAEREGTANENLPETHAILKRLRAALEAHAPDRMFLAEVNQWPEDTLPYFGDGDECHMAFHFPLMPRMYMAIAQEDRFPISDIMRQTPQIPENCQWAIFLRNHDELTLEMVTDRERDYLWATYAADHRARLNLGIRRRLAPLLERDRRRIELMNGLLLSMPGTPVMYYGDEIGMGDNIHLGDRDGVRTPMQWSPDRNGGFSRADPEALVLPPIMDPVSGYQALNVEAQAKDPHSLLNWTRRMLAVRRRHRAFGRGGMRFLYPGNRRILAYIRDLPEQDDAGETILCVYNLARTAQAVELDLSAFAGRVPLDVIGGSPFPPIGPLPYVLTLPPYAFYWFSLAAETSMPGWRVEPSEPLPDFVTLVMRDGLRDLVTPQTLRSLETDVLPPYLARRRWLASGGGEAGDVSIAAMDHVGTPEGEFLLCQATLARGGRDERYFLPLAADWSEPPAAPIVQQLALARLRQQRRLGHLTDGFAVDSFARAVIAGIREARSFRLGAGALTFEATDEATERAREVLPADDAGIRRLSAEHASSAMIMGETAIIKILRRLEAGDHPEVEMPRFLAAHGFAHTPAPLGEVVLTDDAGARSTLVIVQHYVRNQGDARQYMIDALSRAVDDAAHAELDAAGEDAALAPCLALAGAIGRRLAEMHAVLAMPHSSAAFAPRSAGTDEAAGWAESARSRIAAAFAAFDGAWPAPGPGAQEIVAQLQSTRASLEAEIFRLASAGAGMLTTRIHGDFHLGRILVVHGDALIIDFEGEASIPLAIRRRKASPLRDVAGVLWSLDDAALTVRHARLASGARPARRCDAIVERFRNEVSASFTLAYRASEVAAPHRWVDDNAWDGLVRLFLVETVADAVCREAALRHGRIGIPAEGLARLCGLAREGRLSDEPGFD